MAVRSRLRGARLADLLGGATSSAAALAARAPRPATGSVLPALPGIPAKNAAAAAGHPLATPATSPPAPAAIVAVSVAAAHATAGATLRATAAAIAGTAVHPAPCRRLLPRSAPLLPLLKAQDPAENAPCSRYPLRFALLAALEALPARH